jgi:hypothetical protein
MFALLWLSFGVPFKLLFRLVFRLVFWLEFCPVSCLWIGMRYRLSLMALYTRLYIDQLRA